MLNTDWIQWATNQSSLWEIVSQNWTIPFAPPHLEPKANTKLEDILISPVQLGILTGVLITCFLRFTTTNGENENLMKWRNVEFRKWVYTFATFINFLILSPILVSICCAFGIYKRIAGFRLKNKYGNRFKGFLEGPDIVWALEDDLSRSVINIMSFIEVEEVESSERKLPYAEILLSLRKRVSSKLMREYQPHPKMFYKRKNELGFFFWTNESDLTVEDYIRYLDVLPIESDEDKCITEKQLRVYMGKLSNTELPGKHTSSWEILVGKQPVKTKDSNYRYPLVFRVHHSLGDGVALLRLLLETIADRDSPSINLWRKCSNARIEDIDFSKFVMPVVVKKSIRDKLPTYNGILQIVSTIGSMLKLTFLAPAVCFDQTVLRPVDENPIHGPKMSGEKVISWLNESDSSVNLLNTIKMVKRRIPGSRFSDIFLTALSSSLHKYFSLKEEKLPNGITVVLPARIQKESAKLKIHNRFSVALQTLPIEAGIQLQDSNKIAKIYERIENVKKNSDLLRSSPDYRVNYWIMSFVAGLFPDTVLRTIMTSAHSTMAVSNLPGPQEQIKIQNLELKNVCFWLPNIGTTGIGITILSYGGELQLGILADKSVIPTEDDVDSILKGIEDEIRNMDDVLLK